MEIKRYLPLFKLRVCSLITFSAVVGLIAAQTGVFSAKKAVLLVVATMLASTAASAFNHYFDRDIDSLMARTMKRPLPSGAVSGLKGVTPSKAVLILSVLMFMLSICLSLLTLNKMVALHLTLGAFVYAVVYTAWLKRRSWLNIIIGGLAGSFAVLAGGATATPYLCLSPVLLAIVMFFWTPSHFWSFAIYHKEDYAKAGVPMLPVVAGDSRTAWYILINTVLLVASSFIPVFYGYHGYAYAISAALAGAYFLFWNIRLIKTPTKEVAWKNFKASMLYLGMLFGAVIVDMLINRI